MYCYIVLSIDGNLSNSLEAEVDVIFSCLNSGCYLFSKIVLSHSKPKLMLPTTTEALEGSS